ncbi:hypothetical protein ESZ28_08220 [Colwellia hornerae]|uniref:Uncharacterized protein n=1 Tax=Colwellia hornerae TaxID=89402 RepID=A0A5C6QK68_9GAMM|nr:hypothetical protein ESZ28_08220 [Colwellia hornerae]TWX60942.1 hypothetical protein ESZ26_06995 [Colwellia hornerae]TWX69241.1 hypothetical protein ESZ27_05755 [Colwellia hornerae]
MWSRRNWPNRVSNRTFWSIYITRVRLLL